MSQRSLVTQVNGNTPSQVLPWHSETAFILPPPPKKIFSFIRKLWSSVLPAAVNRGLIMCLFLRSKDIFSVTVKDLQSCSTDVKKQTKISTLIKCRKTRQPSNKSVVSDFRSLRMLTTIISHWQVSVKWRTVTHYRRTLSSSCLIQSPCSTQGWAGSTAVRLDVTRHPELKLLLHRKHARTQTFSPLTMGRMSPASRSGSPSVCSPCWVCFLWLEGRQGQMGLFDWSH